VITLTVPSGVDYDLYVFDGCGGTQLGSSAAGTGLPESITITRPDTAASDSMDLWIEVRYFSGASCSNWTLNVAGRNC
jgi:hypothetical protein